MFNIILGKGKLRGSLPASSLLDDKLQDKENNAMDRKIVPDWRVRASRRPHWGFSLIQYVQPRCGLSWAICAAATSATVAAVPAGELTVVAVDPAPHALSVVTGSSISIHFDQPVDTDSVTSDSFWAFGRSSGTAKGDFTFSDNNQIVTLNPVRSFFFGEHVMVILSHDLLA